MQTWRVFRVDLIKNIPGIIVFSVKGKNVDRYFRNESGGHRFQRISPTERNGRRHTSTITVAVMPEFENIEINLNEKDLKISVFRAGGNGGQNVQKVSSAVRIVHLPTKIEVVCQKERSQLQNKIIALESLKNKLLEIEKEKLYSKNYTLRKNQVGSGMRGDKIRTISEINAVVTCHISDIKIPYEKYIKGNLRCFNS